jgi:hypothetical protein
VGWQGDPQFESGAFAALFEATDGIPRRINTTCDRLLLSGYLAGKHVITAEDVEEAALEICNETRGASPASPKSFAPINGAAVRDSDEGLGFRSSEIDLSDLYLDPDIANKASSVLASLHAGELEERLARLERSNAATMAVLRHLLNALHVQHSNKIDNT